jgi:hypothetical protein
MAPCRRITSAVVCQWFRIGDQIVKTIGIAARFESATEVTLDELRIGLTYPLDADADRALRNLLNAADGQPAGGSAADRASPRRSARIGCGREV